MTTEQTTPTLDDQIAAAEQAGAWGEAMRLKTARLQQRHNPTRTGDQERRQQIAEAEQAGDWAKAMALKTAALAQAPDPDRPPVDLSGSEAEAADQAKADYARQIADAEAAGQWAKAIALKLRRAAAGLS